MKKFKNRRYFWCSACIVLLCVIFGQSCLPPKESGDLSGFIVTVLKPLLDPFGWFSPEGFHLFIRKAGHFTEYFLFSFCFAQLCRDIPAVCARGILFSVLPLCLLIAVCDEFLQSFTGRGSSVRDVVLDFAGALLGAGIFLLAGRLAKKKGV